MRSDALSFVGAERTSTQVLAVANSQRPVSGTATREGDAARGAAGTVAGAEVGFVAAAGTTEADVARSDESAAASAAESLGGIESAVRSESATMAAGTGADFVCSVRREIR